VNDPRTMGLGCAVLTFESWRVQTYFLCQRRSQCVAQARFDTKVIYHMRHHWSRRGSTNPAVQIQQEGRLGPQEKCALRECARVRKCDLGSTGNMSTPLVCPALIHSRARGTLAPSSPPPAPLLLSLPEHEPMYQTQWPSGDERNRHFVAKVSKYGETLDSPVPVSSLSQIVRTCKLRVVYDS